MRGKEDVFKIHTHTMQQDSLVLFNRDLKQMKKELLLVEAENERLERVYWMEVDDVTDVENAYTIAFQDYLNAEATLITTSNIGTMRDERERINSKINQITGREIRLGGLERAEKEHRRRLVKRESFLREQLNKYDALREQYLLNEKFHSFDDMALLDGMSPTAQLDFIDAQTDYQFAWRQNFTFRGTMSGFPASYNEWIQKLKVETNRLAQETQRLEQIARIGKRWVQRLVGFTAEYKKGAKDRRALAKQEIERANQQIKNMIDVYHALEEYKTKELVALKERNYFSFLKTCIGCNAQDAKFRVKGSLDPVCSMTCAMKIK